MTVIDLGSDMRLDTPERYHSAYGAEHPIPAELGRVGLRAPRGVGEAAVREPYVSPSPAAIRRPRCWRSHPWWLQESLPAPGWSWTLYPVRPGQDGRCGHDLLFGEVAEGVRPYGLGGHRHRPEMEMALEGVAGRPVNLSFTPHLAPIQRGLVATVTATMSRAAATGDILETLGCLL